MYFLPSISKNFKMLKKFTNIKHFSKISRISKILKCSSFFPNPNPKVTIGAQGLKPSSLFSFVKHGWNLLPRRNSKMLCTNSNQAKSENILDRLKLWIDIKLLWIVQEYQDRKEKCYCQFVLVWGPHVHQALQNHQTGEPFPLSAMTSKVC